jgi:hypothetical protein
VKLLHHRLGLINQSIIMKTARLLYSAFLVLFFAQTVVLSLLVSAQGFRFSQQDREAGGPTAFIPGLWQPRPTTLAAAPRSWLGSFSRLQLPSFQTLFPRSTGGAVDDAVEEESSIVADLMDLTDELEDAANHEENAEEDACTSSIAAGHECIMYDETDLQGSVSSEDSLVVSEGNPEGILEETTTTTTLP